VSADAWAAPDWSAGVDDQLITKEAIAFDGRFDRGFEVELRHTTTRTYTPAEAIMTVLHEAKTAREAYLKAHPNPSRDWLDPAVLSKLDRQRLKRLARRGDKGAIATLKTAGLI
jgi:hypothetical protein